MVKTLLLVSSIIGGVGMSSTPSLIENDTKQEIKVDKNLEQTLLNYSMEIQPDFKKVIHTDYTPDIATNETWRLNDSVLIQKNQQETNNSVWRVNANKYTRNLITKKEKLSNSNEFYGFFWNLMDLANTDYIYDDNNAIDLYALQLDEINTPVSTNLNLNIKTTAGMDFWTNFQSAGNLDVYMTTRINVVNTTDDYASRYIDTNITSSTNVNNWYNDLVNNVDNYEISTHYISQKIATYNYQTKQTTNYQPDLTFQKDLELELGTSNYVFIKVVRGIRIYYANTETLFPRSFIENNIWDFQLYDTWGNREGKFFNYYYSHNNKIILSGQYIPGTAVEVIDMPGLIFTIIGIPFTFLSTAFNLTMFPNTAYSINISALLWTILGIIILIGVVRLILRIFK